MRISTTTLIVLVLGLCAFSPRAVAAEDELARHLETMRRRVDDPSLAIEDRERIALEVAYTLDRAASSAKTPDDRRAWLDQAAEWLRDFSKKHPGHPASREFQRRIAAIRFEQAEGLARQADLDPTATEAKRLALLRFQEAESQLRKLLVPADSIPDDVTTRRIQATLARLLSEVAKRDTAEDPARLIEALDLLDKVGPERTVDDDVLKADLLVRLGRLDDAGTLLKALSQRADRPSPRRLLPVQVHLAIGQHHFEEALESLKESGIPPNDSGPLAVEIRLAQRRDSENAKERLDAERAAFEQVASLLQSGDVNARLALFRLTHEVGEPATGLSPRFWGILAEGRFLLEKPEEAAKLWTSGATQAQNAGLVDVAWGFRYRAAAAWYDAGEFARAAALWDQIEKSNQAAGLRAKAGLLRSTALQRLWTEEPTTARRDAYFASLEELIARFSKDPAAGEARYSLGMALREIGNENRAIDAFQRIPTGHPRRLDALRAIASILRRRVENAAPIGETKFIEELAQNAEKQLDQSRAEFTDPAARAELDLDRVRLQLIPRLSTLKRAEATLDALRQGPLRAEARSRSAILQIARLLRDEQYPEAEKQVRLTIRSASDMNLIDLAGFVDRLAAESNSDLVTRRCGGILEQIADQLASRSTAIAEPRLRELVTLWRIRGVLFRGDSVRAAEQLHTALGHGDSPWNTDLRADTFLRLGEFKRAEDAYRRLGEETVSGSLPWFAARYGLAVALAKEGNTQGADRLIEGAALLDPDLGSPILKTRFEKLRKRLNAR